MGAQLDKAAEIFDAAVELGTPAERMAYLVTACGDDTQLRAAVEELLAHDADAGSFLNQLTLADTPRTGLGMRLGTLIGPYKLLEQIGEGGMGTVFMAEQTHPVQRNVALKIIKAGMDSRQVIARFEAERQALALMDHPNIARVLDAGALGELEGNPGRPYFVMELVKGVPITKYCDEHRLTPKERLELFIPICQAVQHAHQKGIIHRDLKPSNVMICQYDGKPVPKVIDFGIAKATGQKLTEHTLFTEFGSVVGTLEYMSPEQASMNQLDIDTRSDVYSLGVLLYELLTGTTPLEKDRLKKAAFLEVLRLIREEEPPKPSTRLSTQSLPSIAANRGSEPRKLGGLVRGELDWIVMKCLEKDRSRRYETANGLARDVERYLADEAVQACPPSARYRLGKFVRRNKGPLLTAALLSGTLIVAMVLLSVSYLRLKVEQTRTSTEFHRAEAANVVAGEQRAEAEGRLKLVFEALDELFIKEAESRSSGLQIDSFGAAPPTAQTPADLQRERAEREFLEKGLRFYEKLAERPGTSPAAQMEVGRALRRVGILRHHLRQYTESAKSMRDAITVFEKLTKQSPQFAGYALEEADILHWLSFPLMDGGNYQQAEQAAQQALVLLQNLARKFPNEPKVLMGLAHSSHDLTRVQARTGKLVEAVRTFHIAEGFYEQLASQFPLETDFRIDLAGVDLELAGRLGQSGQRQEAAAAFRYAAAAYEKLIADTAPTKTERFQTTALAKEWCQHELAYACVSQGVLLRKLRQWPEAEAALSHGLEIHEKLAAEFPAVTHYQSRLAWNQLELGHLRKETGHLSGAEHAYQEAVALLEKTGSNDTGLGEAYFALATLYTDNDRVSDGIDTWQKCAAFWEKLASQTHDRGHRWRLGIADRALGNLYKRTNNLPAADAAYRASFALWDELVREQPDNADYRHHLHQTYRAVIDLPLGGASAGDWKPLISALEKSIELRKGGDGYDLFFLIIARGQLGEKQDDGKVYEKAVQWAAKNEPENEQLERFRAEAEKTMNKSGDAKLKSAKSHD